MAYFCPSLHDTLSRPLTETWSSNFLVLMIKLCDDYFISHLFTVLYTIPSVSCKSLCEFPVIFQTATDGLCSGIQSWFLFTWLKTFNLTRQASTWLLCFWCWAWFGVEGSRIFHLNILILVASYCFRKNNSLHHIGPVAGGCTNHCGLKKGRIFF